MRDMEERGSLSPLSDKPSKVNGSQIRQPRIADLVASQLRQSIVDGDYLDGRLLPKQDELLAEFEVSRPSLREALRILETEGLITVLRGNKGGAVVHAPKAEAAAYMMGLVLQADRVPLSDLAEALGRLEPSCAAACADRSDRNETTVPILRATIDEAERNVDDAMAFARIAHRFHDELVRHCGNQTLCITVGILVSLWSTQEYAWAEAAEAEHAFPDRSELLVSLRAHRKLVDAIERGDATGAARIAYAHLEASQIHVLESQRDTPVSVTQRIIPRGQRASSSSAVVVGVRL
jgi:GntR family transcriptional regulator, transcriptional repressor for pyruvate dehydrogenase complex